MPRKYRQPKPLQYNIFPSPNTDHSRFLTSDDYLAACRAKPGGEELGVQSSDVEKFRYDLNNRKLYVTFLKGHRTAVYYPVDESIVELFFNASSKGQYVWVMFRDRLTHLFTGYG